MAPVERQSPNTLAYEGEYREWLSKRYTGPQLSDHMSRTRRIQSMLDITQVPERAQLEVELMRLEELKNCSMSVRSQLKRAARFYFEFLSER